MESKNNRQVHFIGEYHTADREKAAKKRNKRKRNCVILVDKVYQNKKLHEMKEGLPKDTQILNVTLLPHHNTVVKNASEIVCTYDTIYIATESRKTKLISQIKEISEALNKTIYTTASSSRFIEVKDTKLNLN